MGMWTLTEGSLEVVRLEHIQEFVRVDVWSIVIRDRDLSRLGANVDVLPAVQHIAYLRSWDVTSGSPGRKLVSIRAWPILKIAIGCLAIVLPLPT
jgi:hypothetical protein